VLECATRISDGTSLTLVPTDVDRRVTFRTKQAKTIRDLMTTNARNLQTQALNKMRSELPETRRGQEPIELPAQCFIQRSVV
jgi:hypothetical protein